MDGFGSKTVKKNKITHHPKLLVTPSLLCYLSYFKL